MTKIPVFKTVAQAYAFAVNNLGAIVGLIWIPMLAVTLIGFFAQSTYMDGMISYAATKNAADLGPGFMWMLMFVFAAFLGNAMMMVPVLQQALGKRQGHVLYHFALGQPEWRMFGAYLMLVGIILALAVVATLLGSVVVAAVVTFGGNANSPAILLGVNIATFLIFLVCFLAGLRLAFLIPAVTLLEEKIDLVRGWNLINGNMWRLFSVVLLAAIPVMLLYLGLEIALFGPAAVLAEFASSAEPTANQLQVAREHMPMNEALGFLIAPLTVGLNAGLVAAVYRAITAPQQEVLPPV